MRESDALLETSGPGRVLKQGQVLRASHQALPQVGNLGARSFLPIVAAPEDRLHRWIMGEGLPQFTGQRWLGDHRRWVCDLYEGGEVLPVTHRVELLGGKGQDTRDRAHQHAPQKGEEQWCPRREKVDHDLPGPHAGCLLLVSIDPGAVEQLPDSQMRLTRTAHQDHRTPIRGGLKVVGEDVSERIAWGKHQLRTLIRAARPSTESKTFALSSVSSICT